MSPTYIRMRAMAPWLLLASIFAWTRLTNLASFPLFVDEGVYLWYADRFLQGDLTRGVGEGKPLIGWIIAAGMLVSDNRILAARLPHVVFDGLTLLAIVGIGTRLSDRRTGFLSGLLWVLLPYSVFFGRLATPDVVMTAAGTLALYFAVRFLVDGDRPAGFLMGCALVSAALAKSPIGFFFYVVPAAVYSFLLPAGLWRGRWGRLVVGYVLPGLFLLAVIALVGYRLRLGLSPPGFGLHEILSKGAISADQQPFTQSLLTNLALTAAWFQVFLTRPVAVLVIMTWAGGLFFGPNWVRLLVFLATFFLAIFLLAANFLAARYFLPMLPFLSLVTGHQLIRATKAVGLRISDLRHKRTGTTGLVYGMIIVLIISVTLPTNLAILLDPARLSPTIQADYWTGRSAGHGLATVAPRLDELLAKQEGSVRIVALHVSDYERLLAYSSPVVAASLRQVHIVGGRSLSPTEQPAAIRAEIQDADMALVVAGWSRWPVEWDQQFPDRQLLLQAPATENQSDAEVYILRKR